MHATSCHVIISFLPFNLIYFFPGAVDAHNYACTPKGIGIAHHREIL
jgi:hypothetical protein